MTDPQTKRTARAICRVEAQRYADRLQQEPWIDLNWPHFVPHARAAMEAMRRPKMEDWHDKVDPKVCHCGRDGECFWKHCPAKDGKCPLPLLEEAP